MAIQNRRGSYSDFAGGANLQDGEFGIVMSGDTTTDDGTGTYISNGGGIVHRLLTDDDKTEIDGDIASLNATLTNSKFENVKIVSVSTNKTTVTINGFPSSGYAYGNILLFSASSIYYIWFGAATPQINRVHGTATAPTGTWDSTTLTYTITFSGSTQITVFAMGGIGRFGTITIS